MAVLGGTMCRLGMISALGWPVGSLPCCFGRAFVERSSSMDMVFSSVT